MIEVMTQMHSSRLTFDENGKAVSAKMEPISDVTDFSFDFGDLDLKKVDLE